MSDTTFTVEATARPESGFWRAGKKWEAAGSVHSELSADDVEALKAEPSLVVVSVFQGSQADYLKDRAAQQELEAEQLTSAKALEAENARLKAELAEAKKAQVTADAKSAAEAEADDKATKKGK